MLDQDAWKYSYLFGIHTIHQNKCLKNAQIIVNLFFLSLAKVDEIC